MTNNASELNGNGLDVAAVHPRNGSRYSPNLHSWLVMRSRKHHAWTGRVYRDKDGTLWIGALEHGGLLGARLVSVLCNGSKVRAAAGSACKAWSKWPRSRPRYVRDGRCAIDTAHTQCFIGDDTRWAVDGDNRSLACGCGKARQVSAH